LLLISAELFITVFVSTLCACACVCVCRAFTALASAFVSVSVSVSVGTSLRAYKELSRATSSICRREWLLRAGDEVADAVVGVSASSAAADAVELMMLASLLL
jgi:hypothetical protein